MNPVKASPTLDPADLLARFRSAAELQGFRVETYGDTGGFPLVALTKRAPGPRPRIYFSAGIHGDEPAGPLALLQLLQRGFFDRRAVWFLCPFLNPVALARGTRETPEGVDLNRDYRGVPRSREVRAHIGWLQSQPRFDLAICLHEDWESTGFYLYERNPEKRGGIAEAVVQAVSKVCPIDLAELIDGFAGKGGIIPAIIAPEERELWAEAIYLWVNHAQLCYTTESPSAFPLEQRIAAQCVAVETAVEKLMAAEPSNKWQVPSNK